MKLKQLWPLVLTACSGGGDLSGEGTDGTRETGGPEVGALDETGTVRSEVYYDNKTWTSPVIRVCWGSTANATERQWVKEAVEKAFESITKIDFTGWGTNCNAGDNANPIKVYFADSYWPSANKYGMSSTPFDPTTIKMNFYTGAPRDLDGKAGNDYIGCWKTEPGNNPANPTPTMLVTGERFGSTRESCIKTLAVHEFAHAIGYAHEQNRSDTPIFCGADPQGENGDHTFGYWDWTSISNYCNVGTARLSPLDIAGLKFLYGEPSGDFIWWGTGRVAGSNFPDYTGLGFDYTQADQLMFETAPHGIVGNYTPIVGDFDGDGADDEFWTAPGVEWASVTWNSPGRTRVTVQNAFQVNAQQAYVPAVGDFDHDLIDDILWYQIGVAGYSAIWYGRQDRTFDFVSYITGGILQPLTGDFDNDQDDDIFWYAPGSAADLVWWSNGDRTFTSWTPTNVQGTYRPIVGDFDADDHKDILWYLPGGTSPEAIWWGNNGYFTPGTITNIVGDYNIAAADFDGNGATDLFMSGANEHDNVWLFRRQDVDPNPPRGAYRASQVSDGVPKRKPYAGDFDGDGRADIVFASAD